MRSFSIRFCIFVQISIMITVIIAIRLKIQTKSIHKIHRSELLRLDLVNLNSWIAIYLNCTRRGEG